MAAPTLPPLLRRPPRNRRFGRIASGPIDDTRDRLTTSCFSPECRKPDQSDALAGERCGLPAAGDDSVGGQSVFDGGVDE